MRRCARTWRLAHSSAFGARRKVPGFLGTEECTIAQQLVETYQNGDQDALIKLTQKQLFNFLEAEVTRLSRQLRVPALDDSIM